MNPLQFIQMLYGPPSRPSTPAGGVLRARARLAKHRSEQAHRLANAAPPVVTRQQLRSYSLRGR